MSILRIIARLFTRPTPTHCTCGRPADIIDSGRPWIVRCARCHLRKSGLL